MEPAAKIFDHSFAMRWKYRFRLMLIVLALFEVGQDYIWFLIYVTLP